MKKKLLSVCLLCLALLTFFAYPASAAVDASRTYNLHRLKNGVGDSGKNTRYYWVDSSASSELTFIQNAMYNWNNTQVSGVQTPIWFNRSTNQSSSVMDIHLAYDSDKTIIAETLFYRTSGTLQPINPKNENWLWGKIQLYMGSSAATTYRNMNNFYRQSTIAHEMGHVFGLEHVTNESSIMNQYKYLQYDPVHVTYVERTCTVNQPQKNDYLTVNLIYGPYNP